MIVVLGSWCEAESRSGRPLVGTWRVFWHQWSPRFEIELARWQSGRCPAWGLPATTMEEERIQRIESPRAGKNGCPTGLIAIRTKQRELAGLLADVCRTAGRSSIWWVEDRLPDGDIEAVLYDLALPTTQAELAANFRPWLPRPIIALADYPRAEDVAAALAAGAASLLSKPLVVEDLIRQFDNA
jgi:CheY-like chemotaxis protein